MDDLIEVPFAMWTLGERNRVLGGVPNPPWRKWHFWMGYILACSVLPAVDILNLTH